MKLKNGKWVCDNDCGKCPHYNTCLDVSAEPHEIDDTYGSFDGDFPGTEILNWQRSFNG